MMGDFFGSFYSHRFYSDVAHNRRGIGAGLAVLLTLVMLIVYAPWTQYGDIRQAMTNLQKTAADMPAVTLKGDKLSIDKPSPFTIGLGSDKDKASIVIDTTYKITSIDKLAAMMKQKHIVLFLDESHVVAFKDRDKNDIEIIKLRPVSTPVTITNEQWRKGAAGIDKWGAPAFCAFFAIFFFIAAFIFNMVISLLTAIVVKIVSILFGADLDYSASVRIATAFRIPAFVIASLPMLAGLPRLEGFGAWAIWGIYLLIGVYSSKYN